jgi:L-fucose mutarotase
MLLNVSPVITGELLRTMDEMGHDDRLAIVNRNYPAYSSGRPVIRVPSSDCIEVVRHLLGFFPLDDFAGEPMARMVLSEGDAPTPVQSAVLDLARAATGRPFDYEDLLRPAFYERARECAAVVLVAEQAPVSCFLLRKGVVR